MKTIQVRTRLSLSIILLGLLAVPLTSRALLIDFNGYTAGSNLSGQPATGTQWSGGGSDFLVTAGAGISSSNAVVTATKASSNTSSLFSPSGLDLPGFNGASSILNVGFQFRFVTMPDANTSSVAAIQFGFDGADTNTAARFYLTSDGRLGFNNGASTAILVSSLDINDTTTWTSVTASLNFATQTYTFSVNGTPYSTGGGTSIFNFRGPTDAAAFRLTDIGSANSKSVAFDNISVTVVPEPSIGALLGVAGLLAIGRRRRMN